MTPSSTSALAELDAITKSYSGMTRPAVDALSLSIHHGEIVVIVGANGSGKTTAMETLAGLRIPDSGRVLLNGEELTRGYRHLFRIGVQLQEAGLPQRLKVKEAIAATAVLYDEPGDIDEVLLALGLDARMDQMVDKLSGGWQRRLDIALACIGSPQLLILDEPTSGLDPVARTELWEFLRRRRSAGTAVLASTHDLSEAESYADRLIVMHHGRQVLSGSVQEVLAAAGGSWRCRVLNPDTAAIELITASGHTPLRTAETITVIGDREPTEELYQQLLSAQEQGQIKTLDILCGPVRLEDVYAYASTQSDTDTAMSQKASLS